MTATQALRVYTRGRNIRLPQGNYGKVEGSSLGMELSRMGRHRKLVLFVKVIDVDGISRTYPHYILPIPGE